MFGLGWDAWAVIVSIVALIVGPLIARLLLPSRRRTIRMSRQAAARGLKAKFGPEAGDAIAAVVDAVRQSRHSLTDSASSYQDLVEAITNEVGGAVAGEQVVQQVIEFYLREFHQELRASGLRPTWTLPAPGLTGLTPGQSDRAVPPAGARVRALPGAVDSFVGRTNEMAEAIAALRSARVVTLVGVGGAGKTRLALEVVRKLQPENKVLCFVSLEEAREREHIYERIGLELGLTREGKESWRDVVTVFLQIHPALLVIDNCEHVIDKSARVVVELLDSSEELHVLATSREPLRIRGEHVVRVGCLDIPPRAGRPRTEELLRFSAVSLFVDRARARDSRAITTKGDLDLAADIVTRLDGIPLAIELAAGWIGRRTVAEIDRELMDGLLRLPATERLMVDRHQSLQVCLDWSYDLLGPDEQLALRCCSVFAGGFSLNALATLLEGQRTPSSRADLLVGRLVDVSLVVQREVDGESRYELLNTVRAFSASKVRLFDESDDIRNRHLEWCLRLVRSSQERLGGGDAEAALRVLDAEQDNIRAAMAFARDVGDVGRFLMFSGLWWYWFLRGRWFEVRPQLEDALCAYEQADVIRARGLLGAGTMAWASGALDASDLWLEEAVQIATAVGEGSIEAQAAHIQGHVLHQRGRLDEAEARFRFALGHNSTEPSSYWAALLMDDIGSVRLDRGDVSGAVPILTDALNVAQAAGDRQAIGNALTHLSIAALQVGESQRAAALARQAGEVLEQLGYKRGLATALRAEAEAAIANADLAVAVEKLAVAESLQTGIGHAAGFARTMTTKARVAMAQEELRQAVGFLAQARRFRETVGAAPSWRDATDEERMLDDLREQLSRREFEESWDGGWKEAIVWSAS